MKRALGIAVWLLAFSLLIAAVAEEMPVIEWSTPLPELTPTPTPKPTPTPTPTPKPTLTPAPTPAPTPTPPTLRRGDSGDEVAALQIQLIEHNYLSDKADGDFGGKTEKAVKQVQADAGYDQTGVADAQTRAYLLDHSAKFSSKKKFDAFMYATAFHDESDMLEVFIKNTGNSDISEVEIRLDQCNESKKVLGSFYGNRNTRRAIYWSTTTRPVSMAPGALESIAINFKGVVKSGDTDGDSNIRTFFEDGHFARVGLIAYTTADGVKHSASQYLYCRFR